MIDCAFTIAMLVALGIAYFYRVRWLEAKADADYWRKAWGDRGSKDE